jgi:hypothetical protein
MREEQRSRNKYNTLVAAMIMALVVGGAISLVTLYSTTDTTSASIAAVAIIDNSSADFRADCISREYEVGKQMIASDGADRS